MDRCPFGPGILLLFGHSQREFKESKLSEFFWDNVDMVGIVDVNREDMVISFGGAWLELLIVEFDKVFFWITLMLLAYELMLFLKQD